MTTILRFIQSVSLGIWIGGIVFSFLVAAGVFATLPSREQAGAVVGMALARLHALGYVCAAAFLVASLALERSLASMLRPAALLVIVMLTLTLASQFIITPRLADLRARMTAEHGSIDATPRDNPLRASFGKLHGVSSALELLVLLLGLAALFFTVRVRQ